MGRGGATLSTYLWSGLCRHRPLSHISPYIRVGRIHVCIYVSPGHFYPPAVGPRPPFPSCLFSIIFLFFPVSIHPVIKKKKTSAQKAGRGKRSRKVFQRAFCRHNTPQVVGRCQHASQRPLSRICAAVRLLREDPRNKRAGILQPRSIWFGE